MTRMAGANPKIAAIFGGGDFGMDYDKLNQQAYMSQSALQNAATMADAKAYMADQEADYITESGKLRTDALGAQASAAQNAQMVGTIGSALSGAAGMFGGGGGSGYTNNPGATISDPTADIQRALGSGVKFGMY